MKQPAKQLRNLQKSIDAYFQVKAWDGKVLENRKNCAPWNIMFPPSTTICETMAKKHFQKGKKQEEEGTRDVQMNRGKILYLVVCSRVKADDYGRDNDGDDASQTHDQRSTEPTVQHATRNKRSSSTKQLSN